MPKISYNKKGGGKILYDEADWISGIEQIETSSRRDSKIGSGLTYYVAGGDTLRSFGNITAGYLATDVTTVAQATSMIRNGVIKGDNAYLISSGALVHKLTGLATGTLNATAPFPHTIDHAHTGEAGSDIINYFVGATQKAFYSFHDDTDWDVGVYDYTADTFDDDFMSTIPASPMAGANLTDGKNIEHPLIIGDDDVLYMGSGRYIHAFDGQVGAGGTFYPKVLTLPVGWIITCFAKMPNNKLAIGAYYSSSQSGTVFNKGEARVWIWGYNELDIEKSYNLSSNYIAELFNWKGTLACFTSGTKSVSRNGIYRLQILNVDTFDNIVEYSVGGLPIRGGVDIVEDDIYWNASGIIYSFTKIPNSQNFAFNRLKNAYHSTSGMLKFFRTTSVLHFSAGATTAGGLMYFDSASYTDSALAEGKPAWPDLPAGKKAKITSIEITFLEAVTGGRSFSLNNKIDIDEAVAIADFTTVTDLKVKYTERADGSDLGFFTRLSPILSWGTGSGATKCPTISKIEYEFEYTNL